eukprot:SAG25_NODE_9333_length_377_cov_0.744604_1_plen_108_part_00
MLLDEGWTEYPPVQQGQLELAYRYDTATVELSAASSASGGGASPRTGKWKYEVDLYSMTQQNMQHEARRKRAIRRTGLEGAAADEGESKRLVVEWPWAQLTSECQRF